MVQNSRKKSDVLCLVIQVFEFYLEYIMLNGERERGEEGGGGGGRERRGEKGGERWGEREGEGKAGKEEGRKR